jgi:hypothetical protein
MRVITIFILLFLYAQSSGQVIKYKATTGIVQNEDSTFYIKCDVRFILDFDKKLFQIYKPEQQDYEIIKLIDETKKDSTDYKRWLLINKKGEKSVLRILKVDDSPVTLTITFADKVHTYFIMPIP